MKLLLLIIVISLILYACSGSTNLKPNRSATQYFDHLANTPATTEHSEVKRTFGTIFSDFKAGATEDNIRQIYADQLYFNDTFKIINNIDDLVAYLSHSASQVESTKVDILDVIRSEHDYFIRWSMQMKLSVKGKSIDSQSIGMSQLRFNEAGQVVFHQDFWDSSEAFFEHLPMVGGFVKKIKSML